MPCGLARTWPGGEELGAGAGRARMQAGLSGGGKGQMGLAGGGEEERDGGLAGLDGK